METQFTNMDIGMNTTKPYMSLFIKLIK